MITLAREARGFTQQDLAAKLQLHKANISRLENGDTAISINTLIGITQALLYPPQFFSQQGSSMPVNLAYRKRQHVPVKLITPIEAQINIIRRHVQFITRAMEKPAPQIPTFKLEGSKENNAEKISNSVNGVVGKLRKKWGIDMAPVDDLTSLLENQGIIISSFHFGTERIDSRSMLTDDNYPVIFLNRSLLGDRQRFSLAYELGHLILHTFYPLHHSRNINHEANLFAAELLMPEKEIKKDFKTDTISLPFLGALKQKWKVSMIALLYRADDLGFLTPNQKRYLVQQFNQQKIRRREPQELDIPPEKPKLMQQLLGDYRKQNRLSVEELCELLGTYVPDYLDYYNSLA